MDLRNRAVALYGRFSPGVRDQLQARIVRRGGVVARDLTRRSEVLVVGALATTLIDSGALAGRIQLARARGVPIRSERSFVAELSGRAGGAGATLPLSTALSQSALTRVDLDILAAFDLIRIDGESCRFADAAVIRTAAELMERGRSLAETTRILVRARDLAPKGRHKIVLTASGEAALQWQDGLTSLEGQGLLPLNEDHPTLEDLFEQAAIAEADGRADEAARLYDLCSRADRSDPIAPYNFANIRLAQGQNDEAALGYQRALSRDAAFVEARYNLAQALEGAGKTDAAAAELRRVIAADPQHPDAIFNLAQLQMKRGETGEAKALYERYLTLNPPDDWAATARKAITYCAALLSA